MSNRYPSKPPATVRRRVIVIEETIIDLPAFMKRLVLFCTQHPLPLPLCFRGQELSPDGQSLAEYRCSDHRCSYREYWSYEPHTGRPYKVRSHRGGRTDLLPYL